jgi:hypothetical protein
LLTPVSSTATVTPWPPYCDTTVGVLPVVGPTCTAPVANTLCSGWLCGIGSTQCESGSDAAHSAARRAAAQSAPSRSCRRTRDASPAAATSSTSAESADALASFDCAVHASTEARGSSVTSSERGARVASTSTSESSVVASSSERSTFMRALTNAQCSTNSCSALSQSDSMVRQSACTA